MSPTSYDHAMTITWIQEFIDFWRSEENISAAGLFFIAQIQNNPGRGGTIQTKLLPAACSKYKEHSIEIEEVQSHWEGFLHLNVIAVYHPLRQEEAASFQALAQQQNSAALYSVPPVVLDWITVKVFPGSLCIF